MKITAITRYKHGAIYLALKKLGWSQAELARRVGLSAAIIGDYINMRRRPSQKSADAIQRMFGQAGEYIDPLSEWPESFSLKPGFKVEQTAEVELISLTNAPEAFLIEDNPQDGLTEEDFEEIDHAFSDLSERDQQVLKARIIEKQTLDEVARKVGVTTQRIGQIQNVACKKLRKRLEALKLEAANS